MRRASRLVLECFPDDLTASPQSNIERPRTFCEFCGWLGISLSAGQEAYARAAFDGEDPGELGRTLFGDVSHPVDASLRRVLALVAGGRGGKTYLFCALRLLYGALVRDLSTLAPGEEAFATVVAPNDDLRQQAINYVIGACRTKPELRDRLRLPKGTRPEDTPSSFGLYRPDFNRVVTFNGAVATRGGYGVRGRWHTDLVLDEAAFFRDHTAKVNDRDIYEAGVSRVLPGGQLIVESTPWAKEGLLYELYRDNFGKPTTALAARAPTLLLNDTPQIREIVELEAKRNPENAKREYEAEFMERGGFLFFESSAMDAAVDSTLDEGARPEPGDVVMAGADAGFRSDSSAIAIAHRRGALYRVGAVLELRPEDGKPLKPSETIARWATLMREHGARYVMADGHYRESITEHLETHKLAYAAAPSTPVEAYMRVRALFRQGVVRIPNEPRLIQQLREVQGRPLPGGGMSIMHPRWRTGGHGDIADAVIYALFQLAGVEIPMPKPNEDSTAWEEREADKRRDAHRRSQKKGYRGAFARRP